ncbi:hypothetical protein [Infirmifilum sp. SLHALR2]|nr:MAG: hypothetical protein B7L53_09755 [Thermofilum sp. NZ13]
MSWRELGVSRWRWYYWRLLGYAERLLQPLRGVLPRPPRLVRPSQAQVRVEQPKSEAGRAAKVASVAAKGREAGATAFRLGLEGLEEADLE